jgi:hypothetical protein
VAELRADDTGLTAQDLRGIAMYNEAKFSVVGYAAALPREAAA